MALPKGRTLHQIAEEMGEFEDITGQKMPLAPPVLKAGNLPRVVNGLTVSQENFCRYVASGTPLTVAYRKSFPNVTTPNNATVYQRANKLYKKMQIKERIDALLKAREVHSINDFARIRQFVVERLQLEAIEKTNSGSARVRALELLGKIDKVKLFSEEKEKEKEDSQSSGDILAELQSRLTRLMGTQGTIEVDSGEIKDVTCIEEESVVQSGEDEQSEED